MKIKLILFSLLLAIALFPIIPGNAAVANSPVQLAWEDNFDNTTLNSRWTWVREDSSLWSLTANPGFMRMTGSGSLYQTGSNDQKNMLLTPAPAGDFRVTTRLITSPTENYHGAGLYVYQDDDNYIELTRLYSGGQRVSLRVETAGVVQTTYANVTESDIRLRITKEGNAYYGQYSEDSGATWDYIGQKSIDLANPKVGLSIKQGPTIVPLTADFDWIRLETINYNSSWVDSFVTPVLDSRWTWVREDTDLWSLSANPGFIRMTGSGSIYQTGSNDQKNMLFALAPTGDFRVTTRVITSPTENYHGAGLYVYQDDDNYIEIMRQYFNGPVVILRVEKAGVISDIYLTVTQNDIRLRITKESNAYYGQYSEDSGATWNYMGQKSIDLANPKVGLSIKQGPTTLPLTADFGVVIVQYYKDMEKLFLPMVTR